MNVASLLNALIDSELKSAHKTMSDERRARLMRLCVRILTSTVSVGVNLQDDVYVQEVRVYIRLFFAFGSHVYVCMHIYFD